MLYYDNPCTDTAFNLALEEILMKTCPPDDCIFSLWQSKSAVVVGRFQNTYAQIQPDYIRQNGVSVVRRITGGGAVYQDLGNVNYSFIRKDGNQGFDFKILTKPVISALSSLGVDAAFNSRNDITVNGFKVSGNAVHICGDVVLHHGTLLLNSDFSVMGKALKVNKEKLSSKGIASVASRVANLSDFLPEPLAMEEFKKRLIGCIVENEPNARPFPLTQQVLEAAAALADSKYRTWEWNYGESPDYNMFFSKRLPCGQVELYIKASREKTIQSISIFGDFFSKEDIHPFENAFSGASLDPESVTDRLRSVDINKYLPGVGVSDIIEMMF